MRAGRLLIALGLAAIAVAVGAQDRSDWTRAIPPFRIADGLYYVGSADLTSFLITGDEGHVLIDAPLEENVELVLGNIRALGFDPADVEIHLASHGHFDHTAGMAAMQQATGGELVLSEAAAELVGAGGLGDFHLGDRYGYPPATAARTVGHLDTVRLGDIELTAHLTPGHTRGCTSWSGTVQIGGRPLRWVSICSLTSLPGYRLVGDDASYPGIGRDFCASVAHLRGLDADLFLASHGSFIGLEDKIRALESGHELAFVDRRGYHAYLDRAEERVEAVLAGQGNEGGCATLLGP